MSRNITVSKIDYYTWKLSAIILLFLFLFVTFLNGRNEYSTYGYIDSFIQTKDRGLCQARFSGECKPTIMICETDILNLTNYTK